MDNQLTQFLTDYRSRLEKAWTAETASPKAPWARGKPSSTGQCASSSVVLIEDLRNSFKDLNLKVAVGKVVDISSGQDAIELHVWLILYDKPLDEPKVIDLAADQSEVISDKVIFESIDNLAAERGLAYIAYSIVDPSKLKPETLARADLLRKNLSES